MKDEQWKEIQNFKREEFNRPEKMDFDHIKKLDQMRQNLGFSMAITSDWRASSRSTHGQGIATDVVFPTRNTSDLYYLYVEAERHNFSGIGIYPHWKWQGNVIGGLHLDSRPLDDEKYKGRGARWICILKDGKQEYLPFTWENMMRYIII